MTSSTEPEIQYLATPSEEDRARWPYSTCVENLVKFWPCGFEICQRTDKPTDTFITLGLFGIDVGS